jgi:hypothetical protein
VELSKEVSQLKSYVSSFSHQSYKSSQSYNFSHFTILTLKHTKRSLSHYSRLLPNIRNGTCSHLKRSCCLVYWKVLVTVTILKMRFFLSRCFKQSFYYRNCIVSYDTMGDNLERIWKEAVVVCSAYYFCISLYRVFKKYTE